VCKQFSIVWRFQFGPGTDDLGDGCDLGHGSEADVATGQLFGLGWDQDQVGGVKGEVLGCGFQAPTGRQCRDATAIKKQLAEVANCKRALPHQRIHGRGQNDRFGKIPGTVETGQEVVTKPQRQLGERVGVERSNDQQVGPLAELDVQDRITPTITEPRPLIPVAEDGIGAFFVCGLPSPSGKLAGVEEVKRGLGGDHANQVLQSADRREKLRSADSRDRARHTQDHSRHGPIPYLAGYTKSDEVSRVVGQALAPDVSLERLTTLSSWLFESLPESRKVI